MPLSQAPQPRCCAEVGVGVVVLIHGILPDCAASFAALAAFATALVASVMYFSFIAESSRLFRICLTRFFVNSTDTLERPGAVVVVMPLVLPVAVVLEKPVVLLP
jgi:hypothetical protein